MRLALHSGSRFGQVFLRMNVSRGSHSTVRRRNLRNISRNSRNRSQILVRSLGGLAAAYLRRVTGYVFDLAGLVHSYAAFANRSSSTKSSRTRSRDFAYTSRSAAAG